MKYPLIKPTYYYSLFREILIFVRNPKIESNQDKSLRLKIYDTIGLYLLKFIFLIPLILFFAIVYDPENVQQGNMAERFSPLVLILVGGIILPLAEEVAFRLSLKFKPIYLAISSSVFCYYIFTKLIFNSKISAVDDSFWVRVSISLIIGLMLYPVIKFQSIKKRLTQFWSRHFRIIYYVTCLVFAWIHITKYEVNWINVLLLPILTLPQLMSAIIYGYIRVSFGFQYPLLFHMSNNLMGIGLSFLPATDLIFT